jgi:hypothetical protein
MAMLATARGDWSETFARWSKPASDTEEEKASRAADMVRTAVREHPPLSKRTVEVYATGSYRNNTNVRTESDIDVAVVCHDSFFYQLPAGLTTGTIGFTTPATYTFDTFRAELEAALRAKFGTAVVPGDKTFNVPENTYRLEADVTPFFEYRRYSGACGPQLQWLYDEGVMSVSRRGGTFVNWHEDHYREGVARNDQTRRRFKRAARILKNVKCQMVASGAPESRAAAEKVPSFLIECLAFNAPDSCFNLQPNAYVDDVKAVIRHLRAATKADGPWRDLLEVNRRKQLFLDGQAWTPEVVNAFLYQAWQHLGF